MQDFQIGMKVELNSEFGVVISSKKDGNELIGVIRWDTDKKSDYEDWRGLFGSFIENGGKIVNEHYKFTFITDDGRLKS